jgi:hypothetical protein
LAVDQLSTRRLGFHVPAGASSRSQSSAALYAMVAASAFACLGLMLRAGLSLDLFKPGNLTFLLAGTAALGVRRLSRQFGSRHASALADCVEYYTLFAIVCLTGAVASYPIAALTHGYADPALLRIDAAFHFNWLDWYQAVARHRALQIAGITVYESIYLSPAILLGWFALRGERPAAHRFLATFWLAAVVTLALFSLMPAVGPFAFQWHGPVPYMPVSELWQPDLIPALRMHRLQTIDLGQLKGLVSAPSFHAAAATIYIATAWRIRPLRWPLTALNLAMLLSTPVEGTHYLADIIIGAAVGIAAVLITDLAFATHRRARAAEPADPEGIFAPSWLPAE